AVKALAFDADGRRLAGTAADGAVLVWQAAPRSVEVAAGQSQGLASDVLHALSEKVRAGEAPVAEALALLRAPAAHRGVAGAGRGGGMGPRAFSGGKAGGEALAEGDEAVCLGAVEALGRLGPAGAPGLGVALRRTSRELREPAERGLLSLRGQFAEV